jgi:hypothetical protein
MEKEVVYIAELDQDVDDIIAAEYLYKKGVLQEIMCDPAPKTQEGLKRKEYLEGIGVKVSDKMPPSAKYVFVGGALTKLSGYLVNHHIECLVMNGGFVGCNIMAHPLKKFKGKETVRTFNFNCDVMAADHVLKSKNIDKVLLVGKNVCHSEKNTMSGIWRDEAYLLNKHGANETKRQHDLLACHEGLVYLGLINEQPYLTYQTVRPYNEGLAGNMTKWGSTLGQSQYREVTAAVGWKDEE